MFALAVTRIAYISVLISNIAYKCANNLAPEYLCAKFKKRSSVHNRTTRNNDKFEIPSFRSATDQRTFAYRAVSLWNMLEEDLRNATTVKFFYFYSILQGSPLNKQNSFLDCLPTGLSVYTPCNLTTATQVR